MSERKTKHERINKDFSKKIREASILRIKNRIDEKFRSFPEMTKMIQNCPSFETTLKELSTIPKDEDLRRMLR